LSKAAEILPLAAIYRLLELMKPSFLMMSFPMFAKPLPTAGVRVIVAGLDMDFKGRPFGTMPQIMAMADSVTKLHAVCVKCGQQAMYSYRLVPDDSKILLGEKESYEARCRNCFNLDGDI
jgi:thymidine kinase